MDTERIRPATGQAKTEQALRKNTTANGMRAQPKSEARDGMVFRRGI